MISTIDRDGDAAGRHEGDSGDGEPEDRDDHRAAGEDDRLSGRGDGSADRLLDGHSAGEVLAVPGDQEERIVDPHAEADHAADHRSPARDVDQVGDQRHRADAEGEPEQGHPDRQAHRDDRSERDEQDDDRGDQADHLAQPVPGSSNAKNRSPPSSTCSAEPAPVRAERLEVLQVDRVELLEHRVLDPDQGDPAVRRDQSAGDRGLGPAAGACRVAGEHVGQARRLPAPAPAQRAPPPSRRTSRRHRVASAPPGP